MALCKFCWYRSLESQSRISASNLGGSSKIEGTFRTLTWWSSMTIACYWGGCLERKPSVHLYEAQLYEGPTYNPKSSSGWNSNGIGWRWDEIEVEKLESQCWTTNHSSFLRFRGFLIILCSSGSTLYYSKSVCRRRKMRSKDWRWFLALSHLDWERKCNEDDKLAVDKLRGPGKRSRQLTRIAIFM